ncbi:MAG: imidazole glycerol phosphate synthase subunit HisH [Chitinophagaceae bacterium]|nr:imidazole glycerol phosphate synthase subunit HisH [Chitinophagaceae bacterium]
MIAIINYGLGNLTSILNMCKRVGAEAVITSDEAEIRQAGKLILPGVGHFKKGMDNLHNFGLQALLNEVVLQEKKPVLGICLGAQLMTMHSEEGDVDGLQWINAQTIRFKQEQLQGLKVPHMGWSEIMIKDDNPLWHALPEEPRFYHVHSYHFLFRDLQNVSATVKYGYEFVTAFRAGNIYGTQFHPEKSHKFGMKVLENFTKLL